MRELLTLAETVGESRAELSNAAEAEKFRYALYYFRKQENLGLDLSVTLDDNVVTLTRKQVPKVEIISVGVQEQ